MKNKNNSIFDHRPFRELDDHVEQQLKDVKFERGTWRIGGRFHDPYWRTILQIDSLEYDILIPGLFKTEDEAEQQAKRITYSFLHQPTAVS